jgi:hypothetical protein
VTCDFKRALQPRVDRFSFVQWFLQHQFSVSAAGYPRFMSVIDIPELFFYSPVILRLHLLMWLSKKSPQMLIKA